MCVKTRAQGSGELRWISWLQVLRTAARESNEFWKNVLLVTEEKEVRVS